MSMYIALINYTQQGLATIKESADRATAARDLARSFGVEMKDLYMTFGAYDFVVTVEAPSDDAAAKFNLALASQGNVRTTTLKAFTEPEFREIIRAFRKR